MVGNAIGSHDFMSMGHRKKFYNYLVYPFQFFSDRDMVESLLRDFVAEDFIADLDFSTLERCSGEYVSEDLRERRDDVVWRVRWRGTWAYILLILEFHVYPAPWRQGQFQKNEIQCFHVSGIAERAMMKSALQVPYQSDGVYRAMMGCPAPLKSAICANGISVPKGVSLLPQNQRRSGT